MSSQAHLSASRVWDSCLNALGQIERDRDALLDQLASDRRWVRVRGRAVLPLPLAIGRRRLKSVDYDIVQRHKADEENRIMRLLGLANEAVADNPNFRIYVSAEDHATVRHLEYQYEKGKTVV